MAATHGVVLRAFEERTFDTRESLVELDRELAKHKKKLRELGTESPAYLPAQGESTRLADPIWATD